MLLGEANGRRFLLMGDVEEGIDPTLLARGLPRVDVLKVAHHGSATATTQPFVDAVRPRVAVASAGADNPYGHPAGSTLGRLRASGARVYRTDEDGSVAVELRHEGVAVTATGPGRSATLAGTARLAADRATPARRGGHGPTAGQPLLCAIPIPAGSPAGWAGCRAGRRLRVSRQGPAAGHPPPSRHPLDTIVPMTIPDRREAARVLRSLEPPAWFVRHACAVADVAAWLAAARRGNRGTGWTAAGGGGGLLHDVDKLPSARCPATSGTARGRRPGSRPTAMRSWRRWSVTTR